MPGTCGRDGQVEIAAKYRLSMHKKIFKTEDNNTIYSQLRNENPKFGVFSKVTKI